jgi:hypothetical protein
MRKVFCENRAGYWLLVLCLFLGGCSTTRKVNWNARVGVYSYDQAVTELGPPDKSAVLSDNTRVAEWLIFHRTTYGTIYPFRGAWIQSYSETAGPDTYLRLTFDAQGILRAWKKVLK